MKYIKSLLLAIVLFNWELSCVTKKRVYFNNNKGKHEQKPKRTQIPDDKKSLILLQLKQQLIEEGIATNEDSDFCVLDKYDSLKQRNKSKIIKKLFAALKKEIPQLTKYKDRSKLLRHMYGTYMRKEIGDDKLTDIRNIAAQLIDDVTKINNNARPVIQDVNDIFNNDVNLVPKQYKTLRIKYLDEIKALDIDTNLFIKVATPKVQGLASYPERFNQTQTEYTDETYIKNFKQIFDVDNLSKIQQKINYRCVGPSLLCLYIKENQKLFALDLNQLKSQSENEVSKINWGSILDLLAPQLMNKQPDTEQWLLSKYNVLNYELTLTFLRNCMNYIPKNQNLSAPELLKFVENKLISKKAVSIIYKKPQTQELIWQQHQQSEYDYDPPSFLQL